MRKVSIIVLIIISIGLYIYIQEFQNSKNLEKTLDSSKKRIDSTMVIPTRKLVRENRDLEIENNLLSGKIKKSDKFTSEEIANAIMKKTEMEFLYNDRDLTEKEEAIIDSLTILIKSNQ